MDLSDLRAAEQAAERICAALPRDAKRYLLINNAGTVHPVSGTDALIDGQAIASAFNLSVTAVMLLTARFLAAVEDLPADRRVLNISSGAGRIPTPAGACAPPRRRWTCTRAWSSRNRARPARVVSLAPGIVDTDMQVAIRSSDPAHFPALSKFQEFHATGKLSSPANAWPPASSPTWIATISARLKSTTSQLRLIPTMTDHTTAPATAQDENRLIAERRQTAKLRETGVAY